MSNRQQGISRARKLAKSKEVLFKKYAEEIAVSDISLKEAQEAHTHLIDQARLHISSVGGRFDEVMEMFGLTSADLEVDETAEAQPECCGGDGTPCVCSGKSNVAVVDVGELELA